MRLKKILPLFLILFIPTAVSAQNVSFSVDGECHDFNVTLSTEGFNPGCYDIKIEASSTSGKSEIFDPRKGWKSSFYYIEEGYCGSLEEYQIRTTSEKTLNFRVKLRNESKTWTSEYYEVDQNCPQITKPDNPEYFFLAAVLAILFILVGMTIYVKWKE